MAAPDNMNRRLVQTIAWTGSAAMMAIHPNLSRAQSGGLEIEEVVVTAQKREERLQDVPIAITVVTGENVARMGVRNLEEVARSTPSFHIQQSPAQAGIYIRSIGSGASNQGIEQSVGLFVDGVYAGRERLFQAPFLDIERIEILKGPQSLILGKNTTAGAVSITTARPTDQFEGSVSVLYGEDNEYAGTAILSGPLREGLSGRLAVRAAGTDGYLRNTFTDADERDTQDVVARGSLRWQGIENLDVLFKAEYAESRQEGNTLVVSQLTPGQLAAARVADPDLTLDIDSLHKSADGAGLPGNEEYNDLTSYNFTVIADYAFSGWSLTSISSLGRLEYEQGTDADHQPSAAALIALQVASDYEQLSQELRLASPTGKPLELMGGAYYQESDVKFTDWIPCVAFASVPGVGLPTSFCAPARWQQDQSTWSAFVRGTWNVTERFRANAGVRYTYEEKKASNVLAITELDGVTPNTNPVDVLVAGAVGGWRSHTIPLTRRSEENWSPSFNLQYDVAPETMLYASFTRGTKGGGFNPLNGTGDLNAWQFGQETAKSYEGGVKSRFWNGRAVANIAAFSSEFEDLQVSQFNGVTFIVTNAGSAKVDGVELDFRVRLTERFTVGGNLAYLDSRYGTFVGAPCRVGQTAADGCVGGVQDLSGEPLPFAPDVSGALDFAYSHRIGARRVLTLQGDAIYVDKHFLAPDNDPRAVQDAYTKVNARVALSSEDGSWEIALIGKNLTDEITKGFENDIVGFPGGFFAHILPGRTVAIQGTVLF